MADSKPEEGKKKSLAKLVLIIVLTLLLLVAASGGAYYFLIYKADDSSEASAEIKSVKEKKSNEEVEQAQPDLYYALDAPLIVNFPPGSSARIIKVAVTVLVKGEASVDVLKKHEPMIRNNLLMAISSMGAERMKTLEGKQELRGMMLNEIGKVMEKMAGKNTAKDVYFTEFVMQ